MQDTIANLIEMIMTLLDGALEDAIQILKYDESNSFVITSFKYAKQIYEILGIIVFPIISTCFLIEFIKIIIDQDILRWEPWVKVFFKLTIAKAVLSVDVGFEFLTIIFSTVGSALKKVEKKISINKGDFIDDISSSLSTDIQGLEILELIGWVVISVVLIIAVLAIGLYIKAIVLARLFEITVMMATSPVPIAFIPSNDGGQSITKRFFLHFAGACLQGLVMYIMIILWWVFAAEGLDLVSGESAFTKMATLVTFLVLLVISLSKSSQISDKMLGM